MKKVSKFGSSFVRGKQRGFSMIAVFAVIGLIALVYIILKGGAGGTSVSADATSTGIATIVSQQSTSIKEGFDKANQINGVALDSITLDSSATTGIFAPAIGGRDSLPTIPQAFDTGATATNWALFKMAMKGVGTDAGLDYVVTLSGVSSSVCLGYSKMFNGNAVTAIPAVAVAPAASASFIALGAPINGQAHGCYSNAGTNVIFDVIGQN